MAQPQTSMDSAMQSIPPTGDSTSDSILSKLNQREEEYNTQVKGLAKEAGELKMPEPPKLSAAPDAKDFHTSPMESFGSAAMFLATFGSLLTKHPLETALNSGAGVLNAYKQKDTTAFTNAMDKWKADTDNAWKQANWQNEMYKDMLNRPEAEARILAAGTKNSAALAAIQSKSLVDAAKATAAATQKLNKTMILHDEYEKLVAEGMPEHEAFDHVFNTSGEKARDKKQQEEQAANFDFNSAKPTDVVPGTGATVQTIRQWGEAKHNGATDSDIGLGYGMNPIKKAVHNYVSSKYPDFDIALAQKDYKAAVAAEKSTQTQTAKIQLASHILDESIPSLIDIAKKYQFSPSTDLNKIYNFVMSHGSSTDKTDFSTQLRAVTTDYAQFIGRGRQTVHSDEEALKILHDDMGVKSLEGFQRAVNTEQKNVKKGIDKAKKERDGGENAQSIENDGETKDYPLPSPKDMTFEVGKWYSTTKGVGKYKGNGEFE